MNNILKARSHIVFILGLLLAAAIAILSDNAVRYAQIGKGSQGLLKVSTDQIELAQYEGITAQDIEQAKISLQYFVRNYNPETGLVNSVEGFPSTTLWDQSSYLLGLILSLIHI